MPTLTFPLVPDYYVNYASGNDTTGDGSLALPWKTIAKFVATAAAGKVCGMMADETISSTITLTAKAGVSGADPYGLVSVGADGLEDGLTKYVDGNNAVAVGFTCGGNNAWWVFRGILVKRCTAQAWAGAYHNSFYRCGSENVAGQGWQTPASSIFEECWATGAAHGFNLSVGNALHACIAIACSTAGFNCGSARDGAMTDCVAHACGVGFAVSSTVRGGVADGCTTGINIGPNHYDVSIVGVQITNNTTGINGGGVAVCTGLISACQWYNNGAKIGAGAHIADDGTSVDLAANPYKDLAGHDFRTPSTSATAAGILVGMYGDNEVRIFPGLPRTLAGTVPTTAQVLRVADLGPPTWGYIDGLVGPGTAMAEAHDPDEVVDTAAVPGNFKVSDLANDKILIGTEWGLGQEGTAPLQDAAYFMKIAPTVQIGG